MARVIEQMISQPIGRPVESALPFPLSLSATAGGTLAALTVVAAGTVDVNGTSSVTLATLAIVADGTVA